MKSLPLLISKTELSEPAETIQLHHPPPVSSGPRPAFVLSPGLLPVLALFLFTSSWLSLVLIVHCLNRTV